MFTRNEMTTNKKRQNGEEETGTLSASIHHDTVSIRDEFVISIEEPVKSGDNTVQRQSIPMERWEEVKGRGNGYQTKNPFSSLCLPPFIDGIVATVSVYPLLIGGGGRSHVDGWWWNDDGPIPKWERASRIRWYSSLINPVMERDRVEREIDRCIPQASISRWFILASVSHRVIPAWTSRSRQWPNRRERRNSSREGAIGGADDGGDGMNGDGLITDTLPYGFDTLKHMHNQLYSIMNNNWLDHTINSSISTWISCIISTILIQIY